MEIRLNGKLAFTTASSKGIGFGVAKVLAMAGADVILLSRSEENLKRAQARIKELTGRKPFYIVADLTKRKDLEKSVKEIADIGDIDIFFFSTGGPKPGYFMEMGMEDWEKAVNLLLYPAVYLTKALLPKMIEKKWGRIIYSTSVAIKEPIPNIALSNVVRISMAGLVKTLAKEVGKYGITVNGILPGIIRTDRVVQLAKDRAVREGKTLEEALSEYTKSIPLGRLGEPEEIGYLVAFLASEYGSYINGAMIPVDGGRLNSVF
jgi:3-oxoacyl-[acyl-carrier protein] reductase